MKVAIMQPYFFPYIGYFQLINAVDVFVVYDNVKYTKKGWFNRNRYLKNGSDALFTVPLRHDTDQLFVREREIADSFDRKRFLDQFRESYRKAPYFEDTFGLVRSVVLNEEKNLFRFLHASLGAVCRHLRIDTKVVISSAVPIDHSLRGTDRVIAICEEIGADVYINPPGGRALYNREHFSLHGIDLKFLSPTPFEYQQAGNPFVPWLSIIDVLMFNTLDATRHLIDTKFEITA